MRYVVYCDESSHTERQSVEPAFVLSAIVVPAERRERFEAQFAEHKEQHGVCGELKWKEIGYSHGRLNFLAEQFSYLRRHGETAVHAMVVHKEQYGEWHRIGREQALYKAYTVLLGRIMRSREAEYEVVIDRHTLEYDKQPEVLQVVLQRMIGPAGSRIVSVELADSKSMGGLQLADAFAGAVANARNSRLLGSSPHAGRDYAGRQLARVLGLKRLCLDTWPHDKVNVWFFPQETRGWPDRSQPVETPRRPSRVTAKEMIELKARNQQGCRDVGRRAPRGTVGADGSGSGRHSSKSRGSRLP